MEREGGKRKVTIIRFVLMTSAYGFFMATIAAAAAVVVVTRGAH